jgi:hypothetical protein
MLDTTMRARRSAGLLGGIMTGVLAMLFVMAFAFPAFAFPTGATPYAYSGKVVAIDSVYRTVTVQARPNDEQIFIVNDDATVATCGKLESFSSLKVGDEVTISYYQTGSNTNIADDIALTSSPGMMSQHCS